MHTLTGRHRNWWMVAKTIPPSPPSPPFLPSRDFNLKSVFLESPSFPFSHPLVISASLANYTIASQLPQEAYRNGGRCVCSKSWSTREFHCFNQAPKFQDWKTVQTAGLQLATSGLLWKSVNLKDSQIYTIFYSRNKQKTNTYSELTLQFLQEVNGFSLFLFFMLIKNESDLK